MFHYFYHFRYCLTSLQDNTSTKDVAFICFDDTHDSSNDLFMIRGFLSFVSVFFLCLTLYIYAIIPDLRETQDKVTIVAIICVTIFLFLLGLLQIFPGIFHLFLCELFGKFDCFKQSIIYTLNELLKLIKLFI